MVPQKSPPFGGDFCDTIVPMSKRMQWLVAALFLCSLLLALEWWAVENYIFWRYVWFDLPMHFLGGLSLGALAVGLLHAHKPRAFALGLLLAFIAWEVFEYVFGLPKEANYAFDTGIDLVMDALGALLAYAVARMTIWRN